MPADERPLSRAEARRRARLAARGELNEPEDADEQPAERAPRGGLLTRLFPPAPPLPNRPDPLAGYSGSGPMRFVTERAFLLRRNLVAWLVPGVPAGIGYIASLSYGSDVLGLIGTFLLFGSLIAAGWFGWQRPTLFGATAGIVAFVIGAGLIVLTFAQRGAGLDTFTFDQGVGALLVQLVYLVALGFMGGWYGGYLRRRQAQLGDQQRARQRRR
jgi:hypothetical protein